MPPRWAFRLWINQLCLHFPNMSRFLCKLFQPQALCHMLAMTDRPSKKAFLSFPVVQTHTSKDIWKAWASKANMFYHQQHHSGPSYALTPWFLFISALSTGRFIPCDAPSEPTPLLLSSQWESTRRGWSLVLDPKSKNSCHKYADWKGRVGYPVMENVQHKPSLRRETRNQ